MTSKFYLNKVKFFLLVFAILWVALGYDYVERLRSVPAELRYIPRESAMVLFTEDIGTVWQKLQPHYDRIIRRENIRQTRPANHDELPSVIREAIYDIQNMLKEQGIPIENLDSLTEYGIDTLRRLTIGWYAGIKRQHFVIVVPITDTERFSGFLTGLFEDEPEREAPLRIGDAVYEVKSYADLQTLSLDTGYFILASDRHVLIRALQNTAANLSFHRNDDILRSNQKALVSAAQQIGLSVTASWRSTKNRWLQRAAMGISLSPNRMAVFLQAAVNTGTLEVLDDFTRLSKQGSKIFDHTDSGTVMMAAVRDPALSKYIQFIKDSGGSDIHEEIANFFGGVLLELENMASANELTISATGYTAGLPDVIMGLTGKQAELENLIYTVQRAKRQERDKQILQNVMAGAAADKVAGDYLIEAFIKRGLLSNTPQSLWHRYSILDGKVADNGMQQNDFGIHTGYVYETDDFRCTYLLPAIDENDIRFRLTPAELEKMDEETLRGNRYRLCSVIADNVLWIGSDEQSLNHFITNLKALETDQHQPTLSGRTGNRRSKVRLVFDMNRVITEGLLNPESDINEILEKYLYDFADYTSIAFDIYPSSTGHEIWIVGEFKDDK